MLTREEKQEYLRSYIPMVEFFAQSGGPNCEIVLRDYHDESSEIVYITHSEISGRKVGQRIRGLMLSKIMREDYTECDYVSNYLLVNEQDQKMLRASTFYIKKNQELCGLICVNYDLTELIRFREFFSSTLLHGMNDGPLDHNPSHENHLDNIVERMIEREFLHWDRDVPLARVDHVENPIYRLYKQGVFAHKGSVGRVAELLNISVQSVYRYINSIDEF